MEVRSCWAAATLVLTMLWTGGATANELEPVMPDRIMAEFPAIDGEKRSVEIIAPQSGSIRVSFVCGKLGGGVDLASRREGWVPVGALLDLEDDQPCSRNVSVTVLFRDRLATDFDPVTKALRLDFDDGNYVGWTWDGDNGLPLPAKPAVTRP